MQLNGLTARHNFGRYSLIKFPLSTSTLLMTIKIVWHQAGYNNKVGCIGAHFGNFSKGIYKMLVSKVGVLVYLHELY